MIKFENTEVVGWEAAIRGMRNPMNSWEKSDTDWKRFEDGEEPDLNFLEYDSEEPEWYKVIGPNDLDLMRRLRNAGTDHRKFLRMIAVYVDITAPLYWWKEFDTYKVGTVANSCSTMHCIHKKEFTLEDFSTEHLFNVERNLPSYPTINGLNCTSIGVLEHVINALNCYRKLYLETRLAQYWWQMIQLLPSSYNQKRTVMLNYEVLANIYKSRKNHKLDEWREHSEPKRSQDPIADGNKFAKYINTRGFCDWIRSLPYSELITSEIKTQEKDTSALTPNEYQKQAARTMDKTLTPNGLLQEGLMGLNGEAGECSEILKKHLFQKQTLDKEHLAEELGDVAWYLAESAHAIGYDLEKILKMNLRKLEERYPKEEKRNEEEI